MVKDPVNQSRLKNKDIANCDAWPLATGADVVERLNDWRFLE